MENNVIYTAWDELEDCPICASEDYDRFAEYCFNYIKKQEEANSYDSWDYLCSRYKMTPDELHAVVTDDIYHKFWHDVGIKVSEYPLIDERA